MMHIAMIRILPHNIYRETFQYNIVDTIVYYATIHFIEVIYI